MYDWSRFFRVNRKIEKDSNYLLRVSFFVFYLLHANYVKNNLYIHLSFVWCMRERMRKKLDPGRPILESDLIGSNRIPSNPVVFRRNPGYGFPSDLYCRKNPWDPTDGLRRFPSAGNYRILLLHPTEPSSRIKNFRFLVRIRISFGFLQESKSTKIGFFILTRMSFRFSEIKNPKLNYIHIWADSF